MIGVMVAGGLGNQMFQYATARALALSHNTRLMLDLAPFQHPEHFDVARAYELDRLQIQVEPSSPLSKARFLLARRRNPLRHFSGWKTKREKSLAFDPNFRAFPDRSFLMGYWQSWRYFQPYAAKIAEELQPRTELSEESRRLRDRMRDVPSVSIHVRRGDYVENPAIAGLHGALGLDYYQGSFRKLQEQFPGLRGFVFSDDLAWCRTALAPLGPDLVFVDCNRGGDSWQDLYLMAACQHAIIANSTFSWWGAWLGDQASEGQPRTVFLPKQWFAGEDVPIEDRALPGWIVT